MTTPCEALVDIGVVLKSGNDSRFALQSLFESAVQGQMWMEDFKGHNTPQNCVKGAMDCTLAASAKLLKKLIPAYSVPHKAKCPA